MRIFRANVRKFMEKVLNFKIASVKKFVIQCLGSSKFVSREEKFTLSNIK